MNIMRHIVGITCELLTIKDPYDAAERTANRVEAKVVGSYRKPNHTWNGTPVAGTHTVWVVQAGNTYDRDKMIKGTTLEGNRSRSWVQTSPTTWELGVFEWDTSGLSGEAEQGHGSPFSIFHLIVFPFVCVGLCALPYLLWWVEKHPDLVLP